MASNKGWSESYTCIVKTC